jgi:chemotaxis protein histidine kinase CheA
MSKDNENMTEYLQSIFFHDAEDLIRDLQQEASKYCKNPADSLRNMMKIAHNLKGSSQLCGLESFSKMMHDFESCLDPLREKAFTIDHSQSLALYLKRLAGILEQSFFSLRDNLPIEQKSLSDWEITVKAISSIKGSSAKSSIRDDVIVNVKAVDTDDWGLSSVSSNQSPMNPDSPLSEGSSVIPPNPSEQVLSVSDSGWGLFEESTSHEDTERKTLNVTELVTAPSETEYKTENATPPLKLEATSDVSSEAVGIKHGKKALETEKPELVKYLLCHNNDKQFAIPVGFVQEILPNRADSPLPVQRPNISGVISFRGQVMAILALFDKQGHECETENGRCIVVCQIGKSQFGFRVDQVSAVIELAQDSLQFLPHKTADEDCIKHLAYVSGQTISIVDPTVLVAA